jgi:hypothetical protein
MELKHMLAEISKLKLRAEIKIPKSNVNTVQSHISRKRSAELRLPEVKRDYKIALVNSRLIVPIIVTGDSSEEFAKVASEETGILALDGEALYKNIASRLPEQASKGKMAPKTVVDLVSKHFFDIAIDKGVNEYNPINYRHSKTFAVNNAADLDKMIKRVINDQVGAAMTLVFNLDEIADYGIENEYDGEKSQLPVLVVVKDTSIVDQIIEGMKEFTDSSYLLTSGLIDGKVTTKAMVAVEEVNKTSVSNALKTVKSNMKKKGRNK